MKGNSPMAPVLKWVGGKRQLLPEIRTIIPKDIGVYYEPFLGGGAVLFDLQPPRAVVNDINHELINVYCVIRDQVEELIEHLRGHRNEAAYFYTVRGFDRERSAYEQLSATERASRILYLNKTCYNGLFRVNQQGEFNAPFGRYRNPNIVNEAGLRAVSEYFNRAQITFQNVDFARAVEGATKGDFVYFDPPYDPITESANFTGYDKGGFSRSEQIRLKELCDELDRGGIKFLLSNSATDFILDLYGSYHVRIVQAKRSVNSKANKRGYVDEVLVANYD
ncbi:MAG: DNA adenine methylase [Firmicutes bacterium]|nr:DNA adenine methylase [Bacillota bacterium]